MALLSGLFRWGHHPRYLEGLQHASRGEFEAAAACFERVLGEVRGTSDPERSLALVHAAQARANLGLACFHAGDYPRAEAEFSRALAHDAAFPDLRYLRGRIYERSGRLSEAVADLERALEDHPRYIEAHLLLAACLGQMGQSLRSAVSLERALELGFDMPAGTSAARAAEWGVADWERLVPAILRDAPGGGTDRVHEALERHQAGDLPGAIIALERAVGEHPSYADLRCRLASLLLEAGRVEEALEQLDHALAINSRYLEARLLATRAHLERGAPRVAVMHAEAMLADHPDYPDLHFWLGLARFRAGDLAGAARALERAVALHRGFARAQRLLGLIYHALGRHGDALQSLSRGLTRDRELPQGALESALPLLAMGETAGAEGELVRAIAVQPDYPDLHLALARTRR
ncbi:MAG: tetratricopeptide repeat protein, partial [Candidatus Eiseniibacteriota bacterium]